MDCVQHEVKTALSPPEMLGFSSFSRWDDLIQCDLKTAMNELNVVLYQPEIPHNTGNVVRTCAALGARLHLIKPLGFSMDDKHLKRAGLDYRHMVEIILL